MRTGISPRTAFISLITNGVLTTYSRRRIAQTSLREHLSPRRPDSHEFGPYPPARRRQDSAHRYCAGNSPPYPSSTSLLRFPSKGVEAIELFKPPTEVQFVEFLTFLTLPSLRAHRHVQGGKRGRRPLSSRNSPPACAVRIDPPYGWAIRNFVKTRKLESLRRGGLQLAAPIFRLSIIKDSFPPNGLYVCSSIFHASSFARPVRRYIFCPSRARCRQAGGL